MLSILKLRSHWSEDDDEEDEDGEGMDFFDFSLPGDVTNYVISVEFDEEGGVAEITMES